MTFFNDPDEVKSDKVDGAIGELSGFHKMNQYYAQGVSLGLAKLPEGWEGRLVRFENQSSQPGRGLCLEPHDLVASKLAANRDKTSRSPVPCCASISWTLRSSSSGSGPSRSSRGASRPSLPGSRLVAASTLAHSDASGTAPDM